MNKKSKTLKNKTKKHRGGYVWKSTSIKKMTKSKPLSTKKKTLRSYKTIKSSSKTTV